MESGLDVSTSYSTGCNFEDPMLHILMLIYFHVYSRQTEPATPPDYNYGGWATIMIIDYSWKDKKRTLIIRWTIFCMSKIAACDSYTV